MQPESSGGQGSNLGCPTDLLSDLLPKSQFLHLQVEKSQLVGTEVKSLA